jgi:cell division protease FtsH
MPASEPTQELVDKEVRRIVDDSEDEVIKLLREHRNQLEALASALLERETLDQPEAYEVAGVPVPEEEPAEQAKAQLRPDDELAGEPGPVS